MENFSKLDPKSTAGSKPAVELTVEASSEKAVQPGRTIRTGQTSVSAALAAANAALNSGNSPAVRFPGEDGGRSLADMAQRDLDAALQLLADRAQYITGANGAAIALRRTGKKDMQCRATTGSNVPELGALLSTEFGLSGESVRTRQPLRCDDAERDKRVNREVCRQMGIASVVVMPVVNDDEVLGVFELFSGQVNAFGERDVSALRRLSEMVETAVRLAHAAENLPQRLNADPPFAVSEVVSDDILDDEILEVQSPVVEAEVVTGAVNLDPGVAAAQPLAEVEKEVEKDVPIAAPETLDAPSVASKAQAPQAAPAQDTVIPAAPAHAPKKPLFWSAALNSRAESQKPAEVDQSHVPPVLRNLRKCEACGFPVSAERTLCVECEEKKWRGQPKRSADPQRVRVQSADQQSAPPGPASAPKGPSFDPLGIGSLAKDARNAAPTSEAPSAPVAHLMNAAAKTATVTAPKPAMQEVVPVATVSALATPATLREAKPNQSEEAERQSLIPSVAAIPTRGELTSTPAEAASQMSSPDFVLSAGLEPSRSWLAANKYILGALLAVAATVAAILLLR